MGRIANPKKELRIPTDISSAPISPSHLGFTSNTPSSYVNKRRLKHRAANNSSNLVASTNASRD